MRIEIETTLKRGIPVVPVLVNGATMPEPDDLPDAIRDLSFHNAAEVDSGRDFHQHMDRLIQSLDRGLGHRRHGKGGGRKAAAWIAAAVVVLTLIGGGAWFYLLGGRHQVEPAAAVAPTVDTAPQADAGSGSSANTPTVAAMKETDKPLAPSSPAEQPSAAAVAVKPEPAAAVPATTPANGAEPATTAPAIATASKTVETPAVSDATPAGPIVTPQPHAPPVVATPAPVAVATAGPDVSTAMTTITAVQDEPFRLCDQPYKLKMLSSLLGAGVSLYPEGVLAMPIEVPEAKPTRVTDTCEVTITDIGSGPAPIVTMQYRPVAANGSTN